MNRRKYDSPTIRKRASRARQKEKEQARKQADILQFQFELSEKTPALEIARKFFNLAEPALITRTSGNNNNASDHRKFSTVVPWHASHPRDRKKYEQEQESARRRHDRDETLDALLHPLSADEQLQEKREDCANAIEARIVAEIEEEEAKAKPRKSGLSVTTTRVKNVEKVDGQRQICEEYGGRKVRPKGAKPANYDPPEEK